MPSDHDDALADADEVASGLLLLYERYGVRAMVLTLRGRVLTVKCQQSADVVPMCRRVVKEHEAPSDRTLN